MEFNGKKCDNWLVSSIPDQMCFDQQKIKIINSSIHTHTYSEWYKRYEITWTSPSVEREAPIYWQRPCKWKSPLGNEGFIFFTHFIFLSLQLLNDSSFPVLSTSHVLDDTLLTPRVHVFILILRIVFRFLDWMCHGIFSIFRRKYAFMGNEHENVIVWYKVFFFVYFCLKKKLAMRLFCVLSIYHLLSF